MNYPDNIDNFNSHRKENMTIDVEKSSLICYIYYKRLAERRNEE